MSLPPPTDNYIGEPQYPAPWTTKKPREGLRDNGEARIVSLAPDVCKSPTAPIPYPIVDFCGHDNNYTPSVRFTSQKAMVRRSNTTHVHGGEPGVGKGVKSGTVGDISEPIGRAPLVRAPQLPAFFFAAFGTPSSNPTNTLYDRSVGFGRLTFGSLNTNVAAPLAGSTATGN
jgi:hypothetical protein